MGFLPTGLLRPRDSRQRLPVYEQLGSPAKERYSDSEPSTDDDDLSDGFYPASVGSPRTASARSSRQSSGSAATNSYMLPHRAVAAAAASTFSLLPRRNRHPATIRGHIYRLPNKVIRCLCAAMIMTIVLLIFTLVRASQLENRRILAGQVEHAPLPPPVWESFDFLTRYYGGVRNLVPLKDNVPQYPREEDEVAYNITVAEAESGGAVPKVHLRPGSSTAVNNNKGPMPSSVPFDQYPASALLDSSATGGSSESAPAPCFLDAQNTIRVPSVRHFNGVPNGFPRNAFGSFELLSLPEDICFERYGRFGPYGYGYSVRSGGLGIGEYGEKAGSESVWESMNPVNYANVDWADAQKRCYNANAHRFKPAHALAPSVRGFFIGDGPDQATGAQHVARQVPDAPPTPPAAPAAAPASDAPAAAPANDAPAADAPVADAPASDVPAPAAPPAQLTQPTSPEASVPQSDAPRTAVVIRCWDTFEWGEEDIMNLRALISELSLASSARYDVHLLVQVKNDAKYPIWAGDDFYQERVNTVPAEFRGLVTLWTETQMLSLYQGIYDLYTRGPDLPVHGVYRGLQMALQHFAAAHPEYEYFWQWEMDIRYTGHNLDLFTKMENWALKQPRKGLWERNSRFYMPDVHGTWDDFRQMARVQSEVGVAGADNMWDGAVGKGRKGSQPPKAKAAASAEPVWGPVRATNPDDWFEPENDPKPPTTYEKDRYVWGVGEEADLITLNPIFDPQGTTWLLGDDITGYNETEGKKPPRRAHIITASRMSRRLLRTMHLETAVKKHHAFPEMWPATAALQHGYKAVYVPHPVYVDREWPTQFMMQTFNGGRNGASGGSRTSVFGQREHNFMGVTWYYNAGFSANLYRRWLGLKINNDGGQEFEEMSDPNKDDSSVPMMRGGEGRMCLPPMLLHPIKGVELPVESGKGEEGVAETAADPSS